MGIDTEFVILWSSYEQDHSRSHIQELHFNQFQEILKLLLCECQHFTTRLQTRSVYRSLPI